MTKGKGRNVLSALADMRKVYQQAELDESSVSLSPWQQFQQWFKAAELSGAIEPNAMVLATSDDKGRPSARAVLLKAIRREEFVFFTNYKSRKGCEIALQRHVALLFLWPELERQVRIEGIARKVTRSESVRYFRSRPRSSQLGAFVSPQSRTVDRRILESSFSALEELFQGKPIPCPKEWGGYAVRPARFEFWQGRPSRLHDRIEYTATRSGWRVSRLAP